MKALWEDDITIEPKEQLCHEIKADCVIIGAGLCGILIANELQSRGFKTVILEANRICSGASMRTTAKITSQHGLIYSKLSKKLSPDTAKLYYESQQSAIDYLENIVVKNKIDCDFKRLPSYIYATKSDKNLLNEALALRQMGARFEYTKEVELPFKIKGAIRFPLQAQFHPLKLIKALSKNLNIYENSRVISVEGDCVKTAHGKVFAQYIVDASHYPIINFPGFYFLRQHQERVYLLAINADKELFGMYYGCDDGHTFRQAGNKIIVGGENHRTGKNTQGGCYYNLFKFARKNFPDCTFDFKWSNQDCITHDSIPFIGKYTCFSDNFFVATGFNKWGMSNSCVSAMLIADLICDKDNDYKKVYSPQRLHLRASAKGIFQDVGHSVMGLSQGLFSSKEHKCKHLGCRLKENADDNTFECPCHGSEFDREGNIIFNPTQKNLR